MQVASLLRGNFLTTVLISPLQAILNLEESVHDKETVFSSVRAVGRSPLLQEERGA